MKKLQATSLNIEGTNNFINSSEVLKHISDIAVQIDDKTQEASRFPSYPSSEE